jgi:DNA-binding MarR family transcriptional regulator
VGYRESETRSNERERWADQREREDKDRLRFLRLTPLQEQLYRCLENEDGLWPEYVIEIVYRVDWHSLSDQSLAKFKNKLRVLQCELNDKLDKAKSPHRVISDRDDWDRSILILKGPDTDPDTDPPSQLLAGEALPSDAELDQLYNEALAALTPEDRKELLADLSPDERPLPADHPPPAPNVEACMTLIRQYLADGEEKDSETLDNFCRGHGCKEKTIRKARQRLGIRPIKSGFGGKCKVSLPPENTKN